MKTVELGFLANIDGQASHSVVTRGLKILTKLTHRGAVGADPLDGDGAGLMIQIPDESVPRYCGL